MNKKYLKYVCKKNIILFIVLIAVGLLSFGTSLLNVDLLYVIRTPEGQYISTMYSRASSGLNYIFVVYAIATMFMSFKSVSYRYNKKAADCFYHLPLNRKELRRFNNLFNIGFILAAFTISYWIIIAAFGIKYAITQPMEQDGYLYAKYTYDFVYYLVAYLLIALIITFMYIYNSLFVQLGNSSLSSFIFLIFGNILVSTLPYAIFNVASKFSPYDYLPYTKSVFLHVDCFYLPFYLFSLLDATIGNLIVTAKPASFDMDANLFPTIVNCLFLLITIGIAIYYCFFVDDPSGEYNGMPGGRNKYVSILIAMPLLVTAIEQASYNQHLVYGIIFLSVTLPANVIGIYVSYAALNKSFKIRKIEWLYIAAGIVLLLIGYGLSYLEGYTAPRQYLNILF